MANVLKVSVPEMQVTIRAYSQSKQAQMMAYLQMYRKVHGLMNTWEGIASTIFIQAFEKMYKNLEQTERLMQDAIDELNKSAQIFTEAEMTKIRSSIFGGLTAGSKAPY